MQISIHISRKFIVVVILMAIEHNLANKRSKPGDTNLNPGFFSTFNNKFPGGFLDRNSVQTNPCRGYVKVVYTRF